MNRKVAAKSTSIDVKKRFSVYFSFKRDFNGVL